MTRVSPLFIAVLFAASLAPAQNAPAQQPSGAPQAPAAAQPSAPAKKAPEAKTPEEFAAFNAAIAQTDPAALEKASNDFAAKYPESELRASLFQQTAALYDRTGNSDKALEMARKTLSIAPNNTLALVTAAANLAEHTRSSDLDKEERLNEALADARKALTTVDDMQISASATPEQVAQVKDTLRSWAYSAIGVASYMKQDYAGAETGFQKSLELSKTQPDPAVYLRLALSQDKLGKYPQAQSSIENCLKLAPAGSQLAQLATQEKDRLAKLAGANQPAAAK